ncbi:DUF4396 domain-containing protein [Jatrophihabitans fulvus]
MDYNARGMAAAATLHCLTGCAIGEIGGLVLGTALGLGNVATMALAVGLAFAFGYALSSLPLLRAGLPLRRALTVVLAADTLSIAVMELVDNGVVVLVPGAVHAGLGDALFWSSLTLALLVAFAVAYPVNAWLLRRGRGHAISHGVDTSGLRPRRVPVPDTVGLAVTLTAFLLGGLLAAAA